MVAGTESFSFETQSLEALNSLHPDVPMTLTKTSLDHVRPESVCVFITAVPITNLFAMGPLRNPVLSTGWRPVFPWFLSFGNRTQNFRVAGASPTTSPSGDLIPTIRGSGDHPGRGKQF